MAEAPLAGHESADQRFRGRRDLGLGEQFERLTLGPEKAPELCDAAQRRFLACDFLDRDLARGETGEDRLQRGVVPNLPAERNVFLRAHANDQAPRVGVGPKRQRRRRRLTDGHPDPLGGEPFPIGEPR